MTGVMCAERSALAKPIQMGEQEKSAWCTAGCKSVVVGMFIYVFKNCVCVCVCDFLRGKFYRPAKVQYPTSVKIYGCPRL